ncbi:MAG: RNA polymerase sigma factor [Bacteroidota bacterium]
MHAKVVDITDEQMLQACARQERQGQRQLYEKYYASMVWVCYRYVKDKDQSEDLAHEGFIKVFRNIERFRNQGSLEGWIKRIMINVCLDYLRKQGRWQEELPLMYAESEAVPAQAVNDLQAEYIFECIQQLPPLLRSVFNLNVVEGYPHKEIGKMLDLKESTSRAYLSEAKKQLRKVLQHYRTDQKQFQSNG